MSSGRPALAGGSGLSTREVGAGAGDRGGPRRGAEVGLYLGIVVQMVPTHFGRSGERGGRQGAPRRRRRSGPACAGGRGLSEAPGGAGKRGRGRRV